ncbi:hypothetical protein F5B20DRAFT_8251 [Whalleya microplaca]|nr:hypothetical protein F5B20DRAFT_8251 [Whalleya microplaca]
MYEAMGVDCAQGADLKRGVVQLEGSELKKGVIQLEGSELKQGVTQLGGSELKQGVVQLKGSELAMKGDPVIIADGSHARLLEAFAGPIAPIGLPICHWLVATDEVLTDADLMRHYTVLENNELRDENDELLDENDEQLDENDEMLDENDEQHDENDEGGTLDSIWHAPISQESVLATLDSFQTTVRWIVDMATKDGIRAYELCKQPALSSFAPAAAQRVTPVAV